MSEYSFLQVEKRGGVARVTINKPPVNALDNDLYDELVRVSEQLDADESTRVIVFLSGLEKIFMAGADIKQMRSYRFEREFIEQKIDTVHTTFNRIERIRKPTLAAITGHALGGGCEFVLTLDFRFMSTGEPRIGLPEINLGIIPGGGGTQRLPRLIGRERAAELMMTGERLDAMRAEQIGLVTRACPPDKTVEEAVSFAERLAGQAPVALQAIKQCLVDSVDADLTLGLQMEKKYCTEAVLSEDAREGISAFLEKREPQWKGR